MLRLLTCCLVSVCVVVFFFFLVVKLSVYFCKAVKYSHISFYTYHTAHTYSFKITPIFFFVFFLLAV